jgi:hypothetical protein
MAFTTIPASWVTSGQPCKEELFQRIKSNEDDLDTRTTALESSLVNESPITFQVIGKCYDSPTPINFATDVIRVPFNIRLTSSVLYTASTAVGGTLTIDVKYKRGAAAWTTIFSSQPSTTALSAFVIDTGTFSVTDLDSGDFLRLDIISTRQYESGFGCYLTWEIR